jgi:hypothetical protein
MGNEKNWNMPQKFENFHFEMKISVWNWKKWPYHQREMQTKLKWKKYIFRLCHWDRNLNNTPIPHIPSMYTTLYHKCKFWCNTINLNRPILLYWSYSNSGIEWYGSP